MVGLFIVILNRVEKSRSFMPDTPKTPEVEDLIRYDILAQEALRGVVKKVLQEVARTGLPGEHHFYVTFDTNFSGVHMSSRMKEKYPEEITIVVQHQYWDLETSDNGFSIGLSFDNIPETMRVPFAAIRGFFDPAVQFGLQFDANEADTGADEADNVSALPAPAKVEQITSAKADKKPKPVAKSKLDKKPKSQKKVKGKAKTKKDKSSEQTADDAKKNENAAASADVVSLDAFRKK